MPDATHDAALRRQVEQAIYKAPGYIATDVADATDAVLAVFAEREIGLRSANSALRGHADMLERRLREARERERLLRERIEAIPTVRDGADSAVKYPRSAWDFRRDVLAVFNAS